jgi:cytochrome bd-type quinol oxidase subunit 2
MTIAGTRIRLWLVMVYLLSLAAILAWPFVAFTSIFAFDAPGSSEQTSTWVIVAIMWLYPVLPLAGVLSSFLALKGGRKPLAYALAGLAALPFAVIAGALLASTLMSVGIVLGGKF